MRRTRGEIGCLRLFALAVRVWAVVFFAGVLAPALWPDFVDDFGTDLWTGAAEEVLAGAV